jgi:cytosine/adenosine deaminase-related metal-dependent hydrolase
MALSCLPQVFWCLCPNANLYIENHLPDVLQLHKRGVTICVGTDSLASNSRLNILSELQTLKKHFPALPWETLLRWATAHGATALQMQDHIGKLEAGMKPGLLHIKDLDAPNAEATVLMPC